MTPLLSKPTISTPTAILCLALVHLVGRHLPAVVVESFETDRPTWRLIESDCSAQIAAQSRVFTGAQQGRGCEQLRVFAQRGSYAYVGQPIKPASVIAEIAPSLWIKSDRVGLQLLARVVLPRTIDPRSGRPLTTLLAGTSYQKVGSWQRLSIDDAAIRLTRQERVLRAQFGREVDAREAYIDLILLNAYGGPGNTTLSIDQLELGAYVASSSASEVQPQTVTDRQVPEGSAGRPKPASTGTTGPQFHGSLLEAGGAAAAGARHSAQRRTAPVAAVAWL